MKQLKKWLKERWLVLLAGTAATFFVVFLYTFRLGSLVGGLSSTEVMYAQSTRYFAEIIHAPTFIVHKLLSFFSVAAPFESLGVVRLPSVLLLIVSVACFYLLLIRWYTTRIALLTTLLFATSSWTLTIGRQALPTISYLAWLPLLALMYWSVSRKHRTTAGFLWALSFGLALYIPGMLWFVFVLALAQRKRFISLFKTLPVWQSCLAGILLLVCAIPYLMLLVKSPATAAATLGLPTTLTQITHFPQQLYRLITQIFIFSGANPVFRLGHLPYIDIASTFLFILGLYRLRYSAARKMMLWCGLVIGGWVLGAGLGAINIAIFLPLIYIVIGGGMSYLLIQWLTVFPKNPIARSVGVGLVSLLALLISVYHLDRYFIAWPLNPASQAAFSEKTVVK